jgi:hypothetical protein
VSQNASLIALVAGAYAAYCLQQRGKFIDELRDWWNEMVVAKSSFFMYCDLDDPKRADYLLSFYKLSTAMDTLRLIYSNVNRSKKNPKGYYPFEQVRDIIDLARSIDPSEIRMDTQGSAANYKISRSRVNFAVGVIFQSLRHAIQSEARASVPDRPTRFDSPYRAAYIAELVTARIDLRAIREANKKGDLLRFN